MRSRTPSGPVEVCPSALGFGYTSTGGGTAADGDGDGMFTRTGRIATGAALLALAVSACSAGSSTTPAATGGSTGSGGGSAGSITIGLVAEPASLDFTKTDGAAIPQALLTNVYGTLVKQDQDGKIVP